MATAQPPPFEERVKKSVPFDWGYGSTPRTSKLRNALYWKAAVSENELENAAIGLPRVRFREGVRIDMDRARIVTAAIRETEGQPVPLQYARMVEKLCEEMQAAGTLELGRVIAVLVEHLGIDDERVRRLDSMRERDRR